MTPSSVCWMGLGVLSSKGLVLVFMLHPHRWGWRWAIYWASPEQAEAEPLERCVNAGFEADKDEADRRGQDCLYTVLSWMGRTKRRVPPVVPVTLDSDPLPDVPMEFVQVTDQVVQMGTVR